jgi:hypothetical protein
MTREELDEKLKHMEQEFYDTKQQVIKKFCFENNPYKIGDIITNGTDIISIDKIMYSSVNKSCVYQGRVLTKKLEPTKIKKVQIISQFYDVTKKLN